MMIRDGRLERFLLLPFSIGCDSHKSVALAATPTHAPQYSQTREKVGEGKLSKPKMKRNQGLSKASFSQGLQRLIKRFKNFSQFFVYKVEMDDMETAEMEIGFPTDVKHVTHIGLDGSTTINPVSSSNWENLKATDQILSFPSISLQQFEFAMSAQSYNLASPQI
ncbi:CRIB domain-containing protein RIC4 [Sesamum alatum]|uniref:CRIB domain-containing protein RIC4 n=1 Tax=Sesamum alatum TaxID=300844 RepID=A0AAE2CH69_9LAMI|nr:CRIB domain-containing protein RIC4 [Sesamum alatum]